MEINMLFKMPDDENDYTLAKNGSKYWCALWDLSQWLRSQEKYCSETWALKSGDVAISEIREYFYEVLDNKYIDLDEVS